MNYPVGSNEWNMDYSNHNIDFEMFRDASCFNVGEMTVTAPLTAANLPTTITIDVRAYDLGVPHLHSESMVYVYTQAVTSRNVEFIVPKKMEAEDPQTKNIEALLALITGAPTTINNIERYDEQQFINDPISHSQLGQR